jgi:hypothetical protein
MTDQPKPIPADWTCRVCGATHAAPAVNCRRCGAALLVFARLAELARREPGVAALLI